MAVRVLALCLALLPAGMAAAQDTEWISYRDAYRSMVVFEKYGKPKQLLQQHYQLSARDGSALPDGLRLDLRGKSTRLNLPLDPLGRAVFPLQKAAYDENAELTVNGRLAKYAAGPRISIVPRPDGVYEAAELRAACEQALAFQRHVDAAAYRGKQCAGVRFSYARKADAAVRLRREHDGVPLPVAEAPAFADMPGPVFSVVNVRVEPGDKGQVVSQHAPLAIAPLYE